MRKKLDLQCAIREVWRSQCLPRWKKIYMRNIQLFDVKNTFLRIYFTIINKIYFNYTTFRQLYM